MSNISVYVRATRLFFGSETHDARETPFEIKLINRLESWLRNGRDHARTGRSGQSFLGKITYDDLVGVVP